MIILLRGHIRDSLNNDKLYNFISELSKKNDVEIYIHTWNIKNTDLSWDKSRRIDYTCVTFELLNDYFKDLNKLIKHIIIDDDSMIQLKGNLSGRVSKSGAPIKGWKNYWYGQYSIINFINNKENDKKKFILNMRFDIFNFDRLYSLDYFNNNILNIIEKYKDKKLNKNIFLYELFVNFSHKNLGIDNIFFGNIETMYKLISHFHNNLDQILEKNNNICHQEYLVPYINYEIFNI